MVSTDNWAASHDERLSCEYGHTHASWTFWRSSLPIMHHQSLRDVACCVRVWIKGIVGVSACLNVQLVTLPATALILCLNSLGLIAFAAMRCVQAMTFDHVSPLRLRVNGGWCWVKVCTIPFLVIQLTHRRKTNIAGDYWVDFLLRLESRLFPALRTMVHPHEGVLNHFRDACMPIGGTPDEPRHTFITDTWLVGPGWWKKATEWMDMMTTHRGKKVACGFRFAFVPRSIFFAYLGS